MRLRRTAPGMQGDISAETMISGVEGVDPARRQMLIEMLDIDLSWWAVRTVWLLQCMLGYKGGVCCCCTMPHVCLRSGLVCGLQAAEQGIRRAAEAGADLPRLVAPLRGRWHVLTASSRPESWVSYVSTASIILTML